MRPDEDEQPTPPLWLAWIYPLAMTAFVGLIQIAWLRADRTAPFWDMGRHGANALSLFDTLTQPGLSWLDRLRLAYDGPDTYYPPLYYWAAALPIALAGRSPHAIAATGILFAAVLNISVLRMSWRLGGRPAALLAPLVASAIPILFDFTHQIMLDFPLTAFVGLALALLLERPFETVRRSSILLGAVLGLGFLTKWTFPAFVVLPCAWAWVAAARRNNWSGQLLLRLIGTLLPAAIVSLPWFLMHQKSLANTREATAFVPGLAAASAGILPRVIDQGLFLFRNQMDLPSIVLLFGGALLVLRRGDTRRTSAPLLLCLLSSLLVWGVFGKHEDVRFSMPQLAAVVPLIAAAPSLASALLGPVFLIPGELLVVAWSVLAVINLALAPALFRSGPLQKWRVFAQFAYHSGPPSDAIPEGPMAAVFRDIAASGREPSAQFQADRDVRGVDELTAHFEAVRNHILLVKADAAFAIDFRAGSPPAQAEAGTRLYPAPKAGGYLEVRDQDAPWERDARAHLRWRKSSELPLPLDAFSIVHVAAASGALVLVNGDRELDGAVLSDGSPGDFVVRGGHGARLQLWRPADAPDAPDQLSLRAPKPLPPLSMEIETGLHFPVRAHVPSRGPAVYTGDLNDNVVLAGPYLTLPHGSWEACATYQSTSSSNDGSVILEPYGMAHARSQEVRLDGHSRAGTVIAPFELPWLSMNASYAVRVRGIHADAAVVTGTALRVTGLDRLKRVLDLNPVLLAHRAVFRVVE